MNFFLPFPPFEIGHTMQWHNFYARQKRCFSPCKCQIKALLNRWAAVVRRDLLARDGTMVRLVRIEMQDNGWIWIVDSRLSRVSFVCIQQRENVKMLNVNREWNNNWKLKDAGAGWYEKIQWRENISRLLIHVIFTCFFDFAVERDLLWVWNGNSQIHKFLSQTQTLLLSGKRFHWNVKNDFCNLNMNKKEKKAEKRRKISFRWQWRKLKYFFRDLGKMKIFVKCFLNHFPRLLCSNRAERRKTNEKNISIRCEIMHELDGYFCDSILRLFTALFLLFI